MGSMSTTDAGPVAGGSPGARGDGADAQPSAKRQVSVIGERCSSMRRASHFGRPVVSLHDERETIPSFKSLGAFQSEALEVCADVGDQHPFPQ
jgi:hypothetical protein